MSYKIFVASLVSLTSLGSFQLVGAEDPCVPTKLSQTKQMVAINAQFDSTDTAETVPTKSLGDAAQLICPIER
jgi:hypothetical protein